MLKSKFDMKDMGLADVILGIKIIRTQNGLVLSQAHYVDKILNTHNAGDSGQARTPIDTSTRPDLAICNRHPAVIEGYSDANWISDIKDSRSTSGYVFTLGGAAISWKSSKQTVIAKSTMESEFIALDKCGEEAEWLRQFVEDIPRWPKPREVGRFEGLWAQFLRAKLAEPASAHDHDGNDYRGLTRMTNTQTPPPATTVVIPTGAPVTNTVANHAERPEKFNGQNFKRWQQKMFFYLTTLGLARFLKETVPQVEPPAEDPLYNVYCKPRTAKGSYGSPLERNRGQSVKTCIFCYNKKDIHAEGMTLSETFQVAAIIEKLPPSWVEFKNYLKHKRKEMSVEDLVVRLRIEEDNKLAQKDTYTPESAKANMVEHAGSSSRFNSKGNKKDKRKNDKKGKGKSEYLAPKAGIVKQKFQGTCYNCDQPGHRAANCKMPKRANPRQANMVNDDVDMIAMVSDVVAMISEVNLVGTNNSGWWIDTGATRHVCADKSMFHSFRAVDNDKCCNMGKPALLKSRGEGDVYFEDAAEKELKLTNVFKDEAIDKFVLYKTEVENQLGKKIKVVRSDRGGEYVAPFAELCAKTWNRHESLLPITQQNCKLLKGIEPNLERNGYYCHTPRKRQRKRLLRIKGWEDKPSIQYLRVWGCLAKVAVPTPKAQKIGPKSVDCIFIGYAKKSTAYRFIVHESKNPDIQKNTIMESRNASFFENIFPCLSKETGSSSRLDDKVVKNKRQRKDNDLQDETYKIKPDEEEEEPRRSKGQKRKSFGPIFDSFMVEKKKKLNHIYRSGKLPGRATMERSHQK
ncbi:retrotransposon protein, putative, ty1-copia subclass [Tanacetum coccineum]